MLAELWTAKTSLPPARRHGRHDHPFVAPRPHLLRPRSGRCTATRNIVPTDCSVLPYRQTTRRPTVEHSGLRLVVAHARAAEQPDAEFDSDSELDNDSDLEDGSHTESDIVDDDDTESDEEVIDAALLHLPCASAASLHSSVQLEVRL